MVWDPSYIFRITEQESGSVLHGLECIYFKGGRGTKNVIHERLTRGVGQQALLEGEKGAVNERISIHSPSVRCLSGRRSTQK